MTVWQDVRLHGPKALGLTAALAGSPPPSTTTLPSRTAGAVPPL